MDDCLTRIYAEPRDSRLMILAPWMTAKPAILREELPRLQQRGFQRVRLNGEIRRLDEPNLIDSKASSDQRRNRRGSGRAQAKSAQPTRRFARSRF